MLKISRMKNLLHANNKRNSKYYFLYYYFIIILAFKFKKSDYNIIIS